MSLCEQINEVRPLSVQELKNIVEKLGQKGKVEVIDAEKLRSSSVTIIKSLLRAGVSIIVLLHFRGYNIGHYISIFKNNNGCELYDPEGLTENVIKRYMEENPILKKILTECGKITYIKTRSQPNGSSSCGLWAIMRASLRSMTKKSYMAYIKKNCRSMPTPMKRSMPKVPPGMEVNRNDMLRAVGPMAKMKPIMTNRPAQRYSHFLQKHMNLSQAAAKHLAVLINAGARTSNKFGGQKVAELIAKLRVKIPKLKVSKTFEKAYGGARCDAFNEYCRQKTENDNPIGWYMTRKTGCCCLEEYYNPEEETYLAEEEDDDDFRRRLDEEIKKTEESDEAAKKEKADLRRDYRRRANEGDLQRQEADFRRRLDDAIKKTEEAIKKSDEAAEKEKADLQRDIADYRRRANEVEDDDWERQSADFRRRLDDAINEVEDDDWERQSADFRRRLDDAIKKTEKAMNLADEEDDDLVGTLVLDEDSKAGRRQPSRSKMAGRRRQPSRSKMAGRRKNIGLVDLL